MNNEELLQAIIEYVGKEIGGVNTRMDHLKETFETRMDGLETRLDSLESQVGTVEEAVSTRIDRLEKSLKEYVNNEIKDVMDYVMESDREIIHRLDGMDIRLNYLGLPNEEDYKKIKKKAVFPLRNR